MGDQEHEELLILESNSFVRMFNAIRQLKNINGNDKLVLSSIMSYWIDGKPCHLSNEQIAQENGMGLTTAKRCLSALEELSLINRETVQLNGKKRSRKLSVAPRVIYKRLKEQRKEELVMEDI